MTDCLDTQPVENTRTYRSTPTNEMVTDNTLTTITQWKYVWKNSVGTNSTCDFSELKAYASDDHIRLLISKFQQSGWREATKATHFNEVRQVLAYAFNAQSGKSKAKVEFSPQTCTQFIGSSLKSVGDLIYIEHFKARMPSMRDKELYSKILGVKTPWHVAHVELSISEGKVEIFLEHDGKKAFQMQCL